MESGFQQLMIYVPIIPLIVAYLVGIILAISWWPRHPRVSLLILVACLIGLFNSLALTWVSVYFPMRLREEHGWTHEEVGIFYTILAFVRSALGTLAIVFLVIAALGWRSTPSPGSFRPDDYPPSRP